LTLFVGPRVTLYQHGDFSGNSQEFDVGHHDIGALGDLQNDSVSSFKVTGGYRVTLFQHGGFTGIQEKFGAGDYDIDALTNSGIPNDSISSLIVEKDDGMYI
jgi:hypothetical protein